MAPYQPSPSFFHQPTSPICPSFLDSSLTTDPLSPLPPFLLIHVLSFTLPSFLAHSPPSPSLFLLCFSPFPPFCSLSPFLFLFFFPSLHISTTPKMLPMIWEFNTSWLLLSGSPLHHQGVDSIIICTAFKHHNLPIILPFQVNHHTPSPQVLTQVISLV